MNEKSSRKNTQTPLARIPVAELIQTLRADLRLTFTTMSALTGIGASTLHGWAEGAKVEQVEAVFRLLARVPEAERNRLVKVTCPCMPSLAHPFLRRDRLLVSQLETLLRYEHGVTLVLGEQDYLRSFLATALAHSFAGRNPNRAMISGYDVHGSDWGVPLSGVTYLNFVNEPNGVEATIRKDGLRTAPMVFLNGVYSRVAAIHRDVQKLSDTCHILVTEREFSRRDLARFQGPKTVLTTSIDRSVTVDDDAARMLIRVTDASTSGAR